MDKDCTILIADDYGPLSPHMAAWVERKEGYTCVATATDGVDALAKIIELEPDIVLLDLAMPSLDGLSVLRELAVKDLRTRVIIVSAHLQDDYVRQALKLGCSGYIHKSNPDEIWAAISAVQNGQIYLSSCVRDSQLETS